VILNIFNFLTSALYKNIYIGISAAYLWGVLSILLSPCHLSSIPLIVGFISGHGKTTIKKAFWISFLFSVGILITIAAIGIVSSLMGRIAGDIGAYGNYIIAGIFIIIGLYLMEIIDIPFINISQPKFKKRTFLTAFVLGLIFGIALGPCTFAYMAPLLGIVFKISANNFLYGIILLIVYGLGHCSVIVFAGTFTEIIQKYLNWNEKSKTANIVKKICGVLVILGGIYLIFNH